MQNLNPALPQNAAAGPSASGANAGTPGASPLIIPGFSAGAGASRFRPGFYTIGENFDGRWGVGMPGPREVVDLTGIAAGYRVIKMLKSADVELVVATNGTDTRVYRRETTWVQRAAITGRVAKDAVSYKGVVAIAFGASNAYQFATDSGAGALTFAASTKSVGNAKFADYFLVQSNGLLTPRVTYVRNPNELYYTTDLTDGDATGSTASYIGDNQTAQQYFTSLDEDDTGLMLIGMRHALYSIDSNGVVEKLTHDYPDPPADASSSSISPGAYNSQDRLNFEHPVHVNGRVYFVVRGYDIIEWYRARINEYMAPRHINPTLPRLDLPINAICSVGGWLVVALGSKNTANLKSVTYAPGGNAHLANQFTTASELWAGRYQQDDSGNTVFVWHGILLLCTSALRYMYWNDVDNYLYLASGDSESADLQMRRCLFTAANPLNTGSTGSSTLTLNNGTWRVELTGLEWDGPNTTKELEHITLDTLGLASTTPSLQVLYKITPDFNTTAFTSLATYTDNLLAQTGDDFPKTEVFRRASVRFVGVGTGNTYSILRSAEIRATLQPVFKRAQAVR